MVTENRTQAVHRDSSSRSTFLILAVAILFGLGASVLASAVRGDSADSYSSAMLAQWLPAVLVVLLLAAGCPYVASQDNDPREEMSRRMPGWLQRPLTLLTGKPHQGQQPVFQSTWLFHLMTALAKLLAGPLLAAALVALCYAMPLLLLLPYVWLALALAWLITVAGARACLVTVTHQVIHGQFSGSPRLDAWIADLLGSLLLLQNREAYEKDHRGTHHLFRFMATGSDPDAAFLRLLGFLPGMTKFQLWRQLWKTTFSPFHFHGRFLKARLGANFWSPETPLSRRLLALGLHGAMFLAVVAWCAAWWTLLPAIVFAVAWLLPLTALYQSAALWQFVCEHYWETDRQPRDSDVFSGSKKAILAKLTNGRFMADPLPPEEATGLAWAWSWSWWWARLLLVHLPCRLAVVCTDLPSHDWHHRHESSPEWVDGIYARQRDVEAGCPGWECPYTEVWGLGNAIDRVFEAMAGMQSAATPDKPGGDLDPAFLGM